MKQLMKALCLLIITSFGLLQVKGQSGFWIVGGQNAVEGQFPWIGDVRTTDRNIQTHFCGSALIHPYWVVTAAHCIMGKEFGISDPTHVRFNTVNTNTQTVNPDGGVSVEIDTFFRHMTFDMNLGLGNGYDIGLIRLKEPVSGILPMPLPQQEDTAHYYQANRAVTTAGWGLVDTFSYEPADIMKWTHTKIIGKAKCREYYPGTPPTGTVTDRVICVGYEGNEPQSGAAAGDSGGPLWLEDNGTEYVIGVVSGGGGLPTTLYGQPGLYTNVAYFRPWIDSVMKSNPAATPDGGDLNDENVNIRVVQDNIRLKVGNVSATSLYVQLSSVDGRVFYQKTYQNPRFQTYLLNISRFAQGMYVIRIYDNAGHHIYRKLHSIAY